MNDSSSESQGNSLRLVEPLLQPASNVVSYLSSRSGIETAEVSARLGEVGNDLSLQPEEAVQKYFIGVGETDAAEKLRDRLDRYREYFDENKSLGLFWQDLLTNLLYRFPDYKEKYFEQWFSILAINPAINLERARSDWLKEGATFVAAFKERYPNQEDNPQLAKGETLEEHFRQTQVGLEQATLIGREMISRGLVPITRVLEFKDEQVKKEFLARGWKDEENRLITNIDLTTATLNQVEKHTQSPIDSGIPLESWTYAAPFDSGQFGFPHFGRFPNVMLVSGVRSDQMVLSRVLSNRADWDDREIYRWFDGTEQIVEGAGKKLSELQTAGKLGAFMGTEDEAVIWTPLEIMACIDLGP